MRAALEWAAACDNAAAGLHLLGVLWFQFSTRGLLREAYDWVRCFAPLPLSDVPTSPMGLIGAAWLSALSGHGAEGEILARRALELATDREPDLEPLAMTLISLCLSAQHRAGEAIAAAEAARALAERPPASRWLGLALNRLGVTLANAGDFAGAVAPLDRAMGVWQRQGFRWGTSTVKSNLARSLYNLGDWPRAAALYHDIVGVEMHPDDLWTVLNAWMGLSEIAVATGDLRRAALLLGASERFREESGLILPLDEQTVRVAVQRALRDSAGKTAAASWIAEGRRLSLEEAFAVACDVGAAPGIERPAG
jgi:hypothetical protein